MTTLNVSEADFFEIKENLKTFLKNQSTFADYDFDGAGLNVLLDILSYSTHMNTVYSNLAFAETFLDSAVQRGSVVSRAKELGYTPYSKHAAVATISVSFTVDGNPNEFVLPKNTKFTASSDGESYTFVTIADQIIENNGSDVFTASVKIYQGAFTEYSYTVDLNDSSQKFLIPSKDVDTRFLTVLHKDTEAQADYATYQYIDDLSIEDLSPITKVFFLREDYSGFFEAYFGDDVIGKAMENGNIIKLQYLITNGKEANGAKAFTLTSTISGVNTASITTVEAASSAGDIESTDSIKYLAPFYYQAQKRAVTTDDYKAILTNQYTDIDDVQVWGGEVNDPPVYGRVFIAIKPRATEQLSDTVKTSIENGLIKNSNILSVRPEIVDPDYIDVAVKTTITYDAKLFDAQEDGSLDTSIRSSIENFFTTTANKFGKPIYFSKLVGAIDDTSSLIVNSVTNLTLTKAVSIFAGLSSTYTFKFNNSIYPNAVTSNEFTIDGVNYYLVDIPEDTQGASDMGTIAIYRDSGDNRIYLSKTAGTVNYNTGEIVISNIAIDAIVNDTINKELKVSVSPGSFIDETNPDVIFTDSNVYTNERDQIIRLQDNGVTLTLLPDESV